MTSIVQQQSFNLFWIKKMGYDEENEMGRKETYGVSVKEKCCHVCGLLADGEVTKS